MPRMCKWSWPTTAYPERVCPRVPRVSAARRASWRRRSWSTTGRRSTQRRWTASLSGCLCTSCWLCISLLKVKFLKSSFFLSLIFSFFLPFFNKTGHLKKIDILYRSRNGERINSWGWTSSPNSARAFLPFILCGSHGHLLVTSGKNIFYFWGKSCTLFGIGKLLNTTFKNFYYQVILNIKTLNSWFCLNLYHSDRF